MNTAKISPHDIHLDQEGFLIPPESWNKEVALVLGKGLNITALTADHWKVIDALRLHYDRFGVAPAIHNICHSFHKDEDWVHNLFFNCLNAWRISGLPDPGEEAKAYLSDM